MSPDLSVNFVAMYPLRCGTASMAGDNAASSALLSATYDAGSSFFSCFSSKKSSSDFFVRSFAGFLKYASSNFLLSTAPTSIFWDVAIVYH